MRIKTLESAWADKADELNGMEQTGAMYLWIDLSTPWEMVEDGSCNPFFLAPSTFQTVEGEDDEHLTTVSSHDWGKALRHIVGLPSFLVPLREYRVQTLYPVVGLGYVESEDYMSIRFLEDRKVFLVQGRQYKVLLDNEKFQALLGAIVEQCLLCPRERGEMADDLICQQVPLGGTIWDRR